MKLACYIGHSDLPSPPPNTSRWHEIIVDTRHNRFSDEKTAVKVLSRYVGTERSVHDVLICVADASPELFFVVDRRAVP